MVDDEEEIDVIIAKGPSFTQGPHARICSYTAAQPPDLVQFLKQLKEELQIINRSETVGLEVSDFSVFDAAGSVILSNKQFRSFIRTKPPRIKVVINDFGTNSDNTASNMWIG
jgi:hypothetical protein